MLGSLYSLPPTRWKNNPLMTSFLVTFCRGWAGPMMIFCHASILLPIQCEQMKTKVHFLLLFGICWAFVISIFKDLPDTQGDRLHGSSQTFPILFGVKRVFWVCIIILYSALLIPISLYYVDSAIIFSISSKFVLLHILSVIYLTRGISKVNTDKKEDIIWFYQRFIWILFYCEFFLAPIFL